ncbi:MAG: hypothetical protein V4696_06765 [Pseudomonadota bacterium]
MHVFLRLYEAEGQVVTRDQLFLDCWAGVIVGDDSLNRAIAGVRQIATLAGGAAFELQTIPRTGYSLHRLAETELPEENGLKLQRAIDSALDCWRAGLPGDDPDVIAKLEDAIDATPDDARGWGVLALLLRKAVEYAPPEKCFKLIQRCDEAARYALSLDSRQSDARVAIAGVVPLLGNWLAARQRLLEVLATDPDHRPARHDLAVLEMATGRPSAAGPMIERLITEDPLAATFYYKRVYHLWTLGELDELEIVANRAMQLWPQHPAIWMARFWTLLFTARPEQARLLALDENIALPMPPPMVHLLCGICAVRSSSASADERQAMIEHATALAKRGPVFAVTALLSLLALRAAPRALEVAYSYYLGRGTEATPIWRRSEDTVVSDQTRRVTQLLFLPCAAELRALPSFHDLCRDLGLLDYWRATCLTPDHLA